MKLLKRLSIFLILLLILIGTALFSVQRDTSSGFRVALIGNSYTSFNNMPALLENLLKEKDSSYKVEDFSRSSYTLAQHYSNSPEKLLDGLGDSNTPFDVLVLQDQSQIPGFPENEQSWQDSAEAVRKFAELAKQSDTKIVLFQTWGYKNGDPTNPDIYPDYETMQTRITYGYNSYSNYALAALDSESVSIARVGECFKSTDEYRFDDLFSEDNRHPSESGAELIATLLANKITGNNEFTVAGC